MIKKISETDRIPSELQNKEPLLTAWPKKAPAPFGERLARNLALAGMMLLVIVSVRNEQLPAGETVLTAVQQMIQPDWGESLGKISFVSKLFPETVSVFFDTSPSLPVTAPCFGPVIHVWSAEEPYLSFDSPDQKVYAAAPGQVMSIAHGDSEEKIVRIRHENSTETVYYGLDHLYVQEGDEVAAATCLGTALSGGSPAFELRRGGLPVDPTPVLSARSVQP